MYYSTKRQQFLIDQGYAFKVITNLEGMDSDNNLVFTQKADQLALLNSVLLVNDSELRDDEIPADLDDITQRGRSRSASAAPGGGVRRTVTASRSLSGGDGMAYVETSKLGGGRGKSGAGGSGPKEHNPFFKKMWKKWTCVVISPINNVL